MQIVISSMGGVIFMNNVLVIGGSWLVGKAIITELNKYKEYEIYATYFESPISLNQKRCFKLNIEAVKNTTISHNYN
jgi:dTDP-4-dehydrorhamnose reductase